MKDMQILVKVLPDPVIVISPDTQICFFNEASRDLLEQLETGRLLSHVTRNRTLFGAVASVIRKNKKANVSFILKKPYKRRINAALIPLENEKKKEKSGDDQHVIFIHMRDMSKQERLAKMHMHFIANEATLNDRHTSQSTRARTRTLPRPEPPQINGDSGHRVCRIGTGIPALLNYQPRRSSFARNLCHA